MSSISARSIQQVDKQASEEEEVETDDKEDKAIMTPDGDVQYHGDLPINVTVQDTTPRRDITDGILTCHDQEAGTTRIADTMARATPIADVLIYHKTNKGNNGHQTPSRDYKTLKRDDNNHLNP